MRDDRPYGGPAPPAAVYYAQSDRRGEHPQKHLAAFAGILQADCYSGFEPLFDPQRKAMPITPAFCFAHARRGFFELAYIEKTARDGQKSKPVSPIALEAVRRLDALFEIGRAINGRSADERRAVRQERSKSLLDDMHGWLLRERETLSRSSEVLKPMNCMIRRWDDFVRFLDDGRICLSNNAAERALRGIALGRRNWTFAGCMRGADRAAITLTMITTYRLNDVDPKAGSPTSWPVSPIFLLRDCTNCSLGNGSLCAKPAIPTISKPPAPHTIIIQLATPARRCGSGGLRRMGNKSRRLQRSRY